MSTGQASGQALPRQSPPRKRGSGQRAKGRRDKRCLITLTNAAGIKSKILSMQGSWKCNTQNIPGGGVFHLPQPWPFPPVEGRHTHSPLLPRNQGFTSLPSAAKSSFTSFPGKKRCINVDATQRRCRLGAQGIHRAPQAGQCSALSAPLKDEDIKPSPHLPAHPSRVQEPQCKQG